MAKNLYPLQGQLRLKLLELHFHAHCGHLGSALSCIDLLIGSLIAHKKPDDTFILSKGHAATALYICLNHLGEIRDDELKTFHNNGTRLPAHPAPGSFNSVPLATGSLGHGFSFGAGIAKANKLLGTGNFIYTLLSDGETNEGTTWEAAHFALRHQLDNYIIIIDKNDLQAFGRTNEILGDTASAEKWKAIGFDTVTVDGHNTEQIYTAIAELKTLKNKKPKALIATTVKGKGITFMEDKMEWHYLTMNKEQYKQGIKEITTRYDCK